MSQKDGITPDMSVREAIARYPGAEEVFARHGLVSRTRGPAPGPGPHTITIEMASRVHPVDLARLVADLNQACAAGQS